jgi:hypothetical protein
MAYYVHGKFWKEASVNSPDMLVMLGSHSLPFASSIASQAQGVEML